MVDWVFNERDWKIWNDGWIQEVYGGWFRVYAFTMTLGVIAAILFSAYKFWRKDLQLTQLAIGAVPIVICSLFGASFFGKLNSGGKTDFSNPSEVWRLFQFWQGGMAIHGGVFVGAFVGIIIFYFMGRRTHVSVWTYMDAIIPNILIGQGIGRWGNFFNHEITGPPIGLASETNLWWLPNFITRNTQAVYIGLNNKPPINGIHLENGQLYQLNPIFIYEAFWLIVAWAVITFVIPHFLKWFQKRPENISMSKLNVELKNEYFNTFANALGEFQFTNFGGWKYDRLFYFNISSYGMKNYDSVKSRLDKSRSNKEIGYLSYRWKMGQALEEANNPYRIKVIRSGVEAGAYFFSWNLVRFILELQRPSNHLFIQNDKTLSLIVIGITGLIGLIVMALCQFVVPYLFRKTGYSYEKDYFKVINLKNVESINPEVANKKNNVRKSKEIKAQEKLEKLKQKAK
ncbi:prolipoprotein diacylglyceryl transferase [Spiroplasma alleghenense]|uniref:Prolipoprotein diacylglyceryl transferase n=1 Tax=Spiroplasma alleghenense TaxID=216931 RepID=A0A345Z2C0_9MOLU|nr:prolipoprotein diacylglyceryl transferase family protein [Spiroplasma alleghenense]AXK50749.1 prolipoprotein diacylglyceryl transferase [Spiroplasma alleghenense]